MKIKFFFPAITVLFIGLLAGITIFNLTKSARRNTGLYAHEDIAALVQIINKINETCRILSLDLQQNPINFLNIKKDGFVGSEVGSMNLAYPKKWDGPYLHDNLTLQGKEYMIVHTRDGYFITPGNGVRLPNDKIVGKDIILNEEADIPALAAVGGELNFSGKPLALPVSIGASVARERIGKIRLPKEGA